METVHDTFWVESWLVQPSLNRLVRMDTAVQVEPRIMGVLCCLAARAGKVVSREALMSEVWPDVIVGDDPLNRAISTLRKTFGDDPRDPAYIETIRKVGYRLIAPVAPVTPSHDGAAAGPALPEVEALEMHATTVTTPRRTAFGSRIGWIGLGVALVMLAAWMVRPRAETAAAWQPEPLTSLPGLEFGPAFSPDGSRLAFAWKRPDSTHADLYVRLLNEATRMQLTSTPAHETAPAWSPDGQAITYIATRAAATGGTTCGIFQVAVLGGTPRLLAPCTDAQTLAWSPDGRWLAFEDHTSTGAPYQVFLYDTATNAVRTFSEPPATYLGDRFPVFAPDGSAVAFVRSSISGLDVIMTQPLADGPATQATGRNERIRSLSWPTTDRFIYSSDWDGVHSFWAFDAPTSTYTWLLTGGDSVDRLAHHPTQDHLVYEAWRWAKNIWAFALEEGTATLAADLASTRWDRSPTVAPDGQHVAFVSNRSGSYELWLWNRATDQATALTAFGEGNLNSPQFSPDGQMLAFERRTGGNADLYTLSLNDRRPRRITTDPANDITPRWSADGMALLFASSRSGTWQIWRQPLDGSAATQITRDGGLAAQEVDGRLFFSRPDADGLWVQSPTGSSDALDAPAERLPLPLDARDAGNWTVAGNHVYFVDRTTGVHTTLATAEAAATLSRYDLDTGTLTPLFRPPRPVATPGLAFDTAHQTLYFVQVDETAADLMEARPVRGE